MAAETYDRVVRTVCSPNCMSSCGVNAFVRDDRIVKLEPGFYPDPAFQRICARGIAMATERLHHADRLTQPLLRDGPRGSGRWRAVSWDEAYDHILSKLTAIAEEHGWRANAFMKGSGNYGVRMNLSAVRTANMLGATMFSNLALSGDGAAPVAYQTMLGDMFRGNEVCDVAKASYILCAGKSVADTGHSEMHRVFDAMEAGAKFVVVDPRRSRTAAKADQWIAPWPGTDAALVMGLLNVIVSEGRFDRDFVLAHTNAPFLVRRDTGHLLRDAEGEFLVWDEAAGAAVPPGVALKPALSAEVAVDGVACWTGFDASWAVWRDATPERAEALCGVPAETIRRVAREYAAAERAWIWIGFGSQRYQHGHLPVRAWLTLGALCGNIGKPYAGVNINESPGLILQANAPVDYVMPTGQRAPSLPATQLLEILAADQPYPVRSLWMVATGFGVQTPFLDRFVHEALPKLDLYVVSEQLMTPSAQYADVVLPVVSYYEDDWDIVASGDTWFAQVRRRAVPPVGESRSDHDIFQGLCERLGLGEHWGLSAKEVCRHLVKDNRDPRISEVDWEVLERDGVATLPIPRPYTPYQDRKFRTPSGRIELYQERFLEDGEAVLVHRPPHEAPIRLGPGEFPMSLISYKHPHATHSQHAMLPSIRELMGGEPRLEIAAQDARDREIADGDLVRVFNRRGAFVAKARVADELPPGMLSIAQGWWPRDFVEGHPSLLGQTLRNAVQEKVVELGGEANYAIWDLACNVVKAEATQ